MRSIVTGLLCVVLLPAVVSSQSVSDLITGQRLRVSLDRRLTGTLVSVDSLSLVLDAGQPRGHLRYRLDQIRQLEVNTGRHSRLAKARLGLMAGAALGGLVGATQKGDFLFSTGDFIAMGAGTGAVAGFVVGLGLPRGEKWTPVSIPVSGRSPTSMEVLLGSPREAVAVRECAQRLKNKSTRNRPLLPTNAGVFGSGRCAAAFY